MRSPPGDAGPRAVQSCFGLLGSATTRRIVGPDGGDLAIAQALPQCIAMLRRPDTREQRGEKASRVIARNSEIRARRLDGEAKARSPASANRLESVSARQMNDVEMRSGAACKISRGLNGQSFRDRGMRLFPIGERALRGRETQVVARFFPQCAGLAMHAGDRIRTQRRDLPETLQQEIVAHGRDDARYSRHVELVGADTMLLGQARQLGELLPGENLRMKDRIDVA